MQSQNHRKACWLPGYVAVPPELVDAAISCDGYCDLTLDDGKLLAISPLPLPKQTPLPDPQADADAMLVDLEFRLTLLELEVM